MVHLSRQSKSLVILLILILAATYGAIKLAENVKTDRLPTPNYSENKVAEDPSTTGWVTYADSTYPIIFKYPSGWKVESITTEPDYYVLAIIEPKTQEEMRVYINDQDFFALGGLDSSPTTIGGKLANSYGNLIAAARVGKYYYTFDSGRSPKLLSQFQALLTTVEFR